MENDEPQYTTEELTKSVSEQPHAGIGRGGIRVGIVLIGVIVLVGLVIGFVMDRSAIEPVSASFVVLEDNSTWASERGIGSVLTASGVVTNTHGKQYMENTRIEIKLIDEEGHVLETHEIMVTPSSIPPGGKGVYFEKLRPSNSGVSIQLYPLYEWVRP